MVRRFPAPQRGTLVRGFSGARHDQQCIGRGRLIGIHRKNFHASGSTARAIVERQEVVATAVADREMETGLSGAIEAR